MDILVPLYQIRLPKRLNLCIAPVIKVTIPKHTVHPTAIPVKAQLRGFASQNRSTVWRRLKQNLWCKFAIVLPFCSSSGRALRHIIHFATPVNQRQFRGFPSGSNSISISSYTQVSKDSDFSQISIFFSF